MKNFKKYTYYQKMILIFSISIFIIIIPYIILLYHSSKSKIMESIQRSNNQNLVQIKSTYNTLNDTMEKLCFSIYMNKETQQLLYNSDITYQESNTYIQYLNSTFFNIYPSMYAISVYNGQQEKLYSTLNDPSAYFNNLNEYIKNTEEIPKLHPILRKVPHVNQNSYVYVLSYIIYDFQNTENKPSSYIILEQNANWLMEAFTKSNQLGESLSSRLYLLDSNGTICSEDMDKISDVDKKLIKQYFNHSFKNKEEASYSVESLQRDKYLVTNLLLNDKGDSLVTIQDYDSIFADFNSFRFTFGIIAIIGIILLFLNILIIAKKIYAPVEKTLSYIETLNGHPFQNTGNEFQQLIEVYKDSHDKLTKQNHATYHALKHYRLEKLLTDNTSATLNDFNTFAPDHWLCNDSGGYYRLLLLTINRDSFPKDSMSLKDFKLLLFAIQNILIELLEKEYLAEIFTTADDSIWGILQTSNEDCDLILEDIISTTKAHANKFISVPFDVSYSRAAESPALLNTLYHELLNLHHYHFVYGPDTIINPLTCKKNVQNTSTHIPDNLEKKFITSLRCEHTEQTQELLSQIFDYLEGMKYENIQICVMTFTNRLIFTLKEICTSRQISVKIHFEQIYQQLDDTLYLEELETFLTEYLNQYITIFLQKKELDKHQLFVEEVQEFINTNYSNPDLSSQMIGEHLSITSKYVMKKFQDYSGTSLNDYITEIRMKQAAILLKECKLPISKISEQVGILNENYFYRLFKKVYSCTPREFSSRNSSDNM